MTDRNQTIYAASGRRVDLVQGESLNVGDNLPAAVYNIKQEPMGGPFYLERGEAFNLPSNIYGDTIEMAERFLITFQDRPNSTGVHLDGIKGSGKTLLSKTIAMKALEMGIPVILINQPMVGENFNRFIQSINTPSVVMFDEFEKTYNTQDLQNQILTLFDGVYETKKMFLLTTNEVDRVSDYMKNRPGRMFYSVSFDVLDQTIIRQFLEDNLENKDRIEEVIRYTSVYTFFNFDMLAALVQEMNRFDEPLKDAIRFMNIKPEINAADRFEIIARCQGADHTVARDYSFDPTEFYHYVNLHGVAVAVLDKVDEGFKAARDFTAMANRSLELRAGPDWVAANDTVSNKIEDFVDSYRPLLDEDGDLKFTESDLKNYDHKRNEFVFEKTVDEQTLQLVVRRQQRVANDTRLF